MPGPCDLADVVQQEHADRALEFDRTLRIAWQRHRLRGKLPTVLRGVLQAREAKWTRLALYAFQLVEFANEIDDRLTASSRDTDVAPQENEKVLREEV